MDNILVSIHCLTYNHENFIVDAIESFLMQKTNFKFEVLIHDDASTDRTATIIREYEKRYPDIIKPIYQTENQYSKGVFVSQFNINRAQGKYLAICEGDDYWTDPYKLQKQLDFMEKNPDFSLCVHGGEIVNAEDKKLRSTNRPHNKNKIFQVEEVITGGGGLFLTNSMLFKRILKKDIPSFMVNAPVGDYPLAIYLSLVGKVYYIDEYMSAYRTNNDDSWTSKNTATTYKIIEHYQKIAQMLDAVNDYTLGKYEVAIKRTQKNNELNLLLNQGKFKEAKSAKYAEIYDELDVIMRQKVFIKQYLPFIYTFIRNIKKGWNRWVLK